MQIEKHTRVCKKLLYKNKEESMSIREIKFQLQKYSKLTMAELATVLGEPIESVSHIVEEWEKKGKIIKKQEIPICASGAVGGCSCASVTSGGCTEAKYYYSWNED